MRRRGVIEAVAARTLLQSAALTWRFDEQIPDDCAEILTGQRFAVIAFWHYQMLPLWYRLRTIQPAAVVSPSRDGEILARYLEALRYGAIVRGSSSRGGSEALAAAVHQVRERSVLITPDGPRGPVREAKPGAILAALRADVPLVVAGWRCDRVVRFRSWDRMQVPMPFARITVRYARFDLGGLAPGARITKAELKRFSAAIDGVSQDAADETC
jgi:lysophospholipid acyltransferase (LPLAT)-like uncharacterized protein